MQDMKKRDTKKDFITAFWKLYEKKPIEKITIRELCVLAGYNRGTFYSYYVNIYDLLENAIEDMTSLVRGKLEDVKDIKKFIKDNAIQQIFLSVMKEKGHYIELLIKQQHDYILEEQIKSFIIPIINQRIQIENSKKKHIDYIIAYELTAAFGIIKYWFESGKNIEDRELVKLGYMLASRGPLTLLCEEL